MLQNLLGQKKYEEVISDEHPPSIWSSNFSLQTLLYALLGALHQALLKIIFYCLNYSSNLIFAPPTFTKTDWKSTEQVVGLGDIVKTIGKNVF